MKIAKISKIKHSKGSAMVEYTAGVGLLGAFFILDDNVGIMDQIITGLLSFYNMFMTNLALPL